jgi:hypothetical protein
VAFGTSNVKRSRYRLRDRLGFFFAAIFLFVRSNQSKIEALEKRIGGHQTIANRQAAKLIAAIYMDTASYQSKSAWFNRLMQRIR